MGETSDDGVGAAGVRPTVVIVEGGGKATLRIVDCLRASGCEALVVDGPGGLAGKIENQPADAVVFAAEILQASAGHAPLERPEDIAILARYFCGRMATLVGKKTVLSNHAVEALQSRLRPCDVRQLKAIVERAVLLSVGSEIGPEGLFLPDSVARGSNAKNPAFARASKRTKPVASIEAVERDHISQILRACGGNRTRAAMALGISRSTLIHKIHELRIEEE